MTTLPDRINNALIVIDVQVGVMAEAHRRDGVPVIWVQHSSDQLRPGSDAWAYIPELVRNPSEPLIEKRYGDAFEETELEDVLQRLQVGQLLVCGAQTDACIRSTLHGALVRGYDAILVSDAHTTEDLSAWGAPPPEQVIAHTNLYWSEQQAPGRTAGTASSTEIFAG
jgi:nicotinamidase-related amidase